MANEIIALMVQCCSLGEDEGNYHGLQQSVVYFYSSFFHLITDMLLKADSRVKDPCPDQKRHYSLGEKVAPSNTVSEYKRWPSIFSFQQNRHFSFSFLC